MTIDLEAVKRALEGATPGPWRYRPHEYTDWGEVYSGQFRICQARDPEAMGEQLLALHRKAKTDPWEANARLIAMTPDLAVHALRAAEIERAADALASIVVRDDVQSKLAYDPVFARLAQALAAYRKAKEASQ